MNTYTRQRMEGGRTKNRLTHFLGKKVHLILVVLRGSLVQLNQGQSLKRNEPIYSHNWRTTLQPKRLTWVADVMEKTSDGTLEHTWFNKRPWIFSPIPHGINNLTKMTVNQTKPTSAKSTILFPSGQIICATCN